MYLLHLIAWGAQVRPRLSFRQNWAIQKSFQFTFEVRQLIAVLQFAFEDVLLLWNILGKAVRDPEKATKVFAYRFGLRQAHLRRRIQVQSKTQDTLGEYVNYVTLCNKFGGYEYKDI